MFSELIDEAVAISGRPNRITDITTYANNTIRECDVLELWARDLIEAQLTAAAVPFTWTVPTNFRQIRTANYDNLFWPKFIEPGKKQTDHEFFYYRASDYFVFANVSTGTLVNIAYYSYLKRLYYFAVGARPAVWDPVAETWSYLSGGVYVPTLGTDALDAAARALVTNWLLEDWYNTILTGTTAKILTAINDPRAGNNFANYKSNQGDINKGEQYAAVGA